MLNILICIPLLIAFVSTGAFAKEPLRKRDPDDFSDIKNWAAVGDSYAAGVGSGERMSGPGDWWCSRYDQSYASLIDLDFGYSGASGRKFTNWACSGATNGLVISQLNALGNGSQDMITISSGLNDVGFTDLLNECIFQWDTNTNATWNACEDQISTINTILNGADFSLTLDTVIGTAKNKLAGPSSIAFYVGYPLFFDDSDKQCDGITWACWSKSPYKQFLTQDLRQKLNQLMTTMNNALRAATERADKQVSFIDWNPYSVDSAGRFCENGFPETDANRYGLLYYNWYTDDNHDPDFGPSIAPSSLTRSNTPLADGSFESQVDNFIRQALENDSSLQPATSWASLSPQNTSVPPQITIDPTNEQVGITNSCISPDWYTRVFHPRPTAHQMIANLVLYNLAAWRASLNEIDYPPESTDLDSCPAPAPMPTSIDFPRS